MLLQRFAVFLVVFCVSPSLFQGVQAKERPILAVMEINDTSRKFSRGKMKEAQAYLRNTVIASRSFRVVSSSKLEKEQALQMKKESYKDCYADKCQIQLGQRLSADTILITRVEQALGSCTISSTLVDLASEVSTGGAMAEFDCTVKGLRLAIRSVVSQLTGRSSPKSDPGTTVTPEAGLNEADDGWQPTVQKRHIVKFRSSPEGAVVLMGGKLVCTRTPCDQNLSEGIHTVSMQIKDYEVREESVTVGQTMTLKWTLSPTFGMLSVGSVPSGIPVHVDGKHVGTTPLDKHRVAPGSHRVQLVSPCYLASGATFSIAKGEDHVETFSLSPKIGGLDLTATGEDGNAVAGAVWIDGAYAGVLPDVFSVSVCSEKLEVKAKGYETFVAKLEVEERTTRQMAIRLRSALSRPAAPRNKADADRTAVPTGRYAAKEKGGYTRVNRFCIDLAEVSNAQYQRCVKAGGCRPVAWTSCTHMLETRVGKTKKQGMSKRPYWSKSDHPVVCVSPRDASKYCDYVGGRLPDEEEWMAAARGDRRTTYPWGNQFPGGKAANGCDANCVFEWRESSYDDTFVHTAPVDSNEEGKSHFGLLNMAGNVWEWVISHGKPAAKGGAWNSKRGDLKVEAAYRSVNNNTRWNSVGFRCAYDWEMCQ